MNRDDDPFAPAKPPAGHVVGQPLDTLSVEDLADRAAALRAEIVRIEAALEAKLASRTAAHAVFKT